MAAAPAAPVILHKASTSVVRKVKDAKFKPYGKKRGEKKMARTTESNNDDNTNNKKAKGKIIRPHKVIKHDGLTTQTWSFPEIDTRIIYIPGFYSTEEANKLSWNMLEGKEACNFQPEQGFYGNPPTHSVAWLGNHTWTYSGRKSFPIDPPREWTRKMMDDMQFAANAVEWRKEKEVVYTGALFNEYKNGQDSLSFHSDDEPEIVQDSTIASLTIGSPREFHIRFHGGTKYDNPLDTRNTKRLALEKLARGENINIPATMHLTLRHGSLLLMMGECQRWSEHSVPKLHETAQGELFRKEMCAKDSAFARLSLAEQNAAYPSRLNVTLRHYILK